MGAAIPLRHVKMRQFQESCLEVRSWSTCNGTILCPQFWLIQMIRGTCALLNASTSETQEANLEATFFAFTHLYQKIWYHASGASAGEDQLWWEHHVWPGSWISTEFSQYQLLFFCNDKSEISWNEFCNFRNCSCTGCSLDLTREELKSLCGGRVFQWTSQDPWESKW